MGLEFSLLRQLRDQLIVNKRATLPFVKAYSAITRLRSSLKRTAHKILEKKYNAFRLDIVYKQKTSPAVGEDFNPVILGATKIEFSHAITQI